MLEEHAREMGAVVKAEPLDHAGGVLVQTMVVSVKRVLLWILFVVGAVSSWSVGEMAWMYDWQIRILCVLAVINVILAVLILAHPGRRLWPLLGVAVGLILGQRTLIEIAAMMLFWSLRGFSP